MMRQVILAVPIAFLLLAGVRAEGEAKAAAEEVSRGGHSQQYHYNSYPEQQQHGTYAGLSFDLSTGLFLALGAIIVLLALAATLKGGHGDGGWGAASQYGTYRSLNLASLSEKVLNGVEKLYDVYNKNQ